MSKPQATNRQRIVRLIVASLAFLAGSTILIVFVFRSYLVPAYEAWRHADPRQRSMISASSALLLAVVLVVLLLLLISAFGVRRYFHFRSDRTRTSTKYVDAWAESAKRLKTPADGGDDDRANRA